MSSSAVSPLSGSMRMSMRPLAPEAHAALGIVELRRADAEVRHEAVDALDPELVELLAEAARRSTARASRDRRRARGARRPPRWPRGRGRTRRSAPSVPPRAGPRVCPPPPSVASTYDAAGPRRERPDDLVAHHRRVLEALHVGHLVEVLAPDPLAGIRRAAPAGRAAVAHSPSSARRAADVAALVVGGLEVLRSTRPCPRARRSRPAPAQSDVLLEPRVVAEGRRDEDAADVVDLALDGARDVDALAASARPGRTAAASTEPLLEGAHSGTRTRRGTGRARSSARCAARPRRSSTSRYRAGTLVRPFASMVCS